MGTSGNTTTDTIGLGGEFIYRPAPWESRFKIVYVRNEAEDELRAQSLVAIARAQRPIGDDLSVYGQYGYQRDRFAGIINRNTVEGGLAYTWINTPPNKLAVDGGLGYANEQRIIGSNLSTAVATAGALYALKISPTSDLSEDGHFVASLSEGADWRYANIIALTAKITSVLSLKVSNTIRYVHFPTTGFKPADTITDIALVAKF